MLGLLVSIVSHLFEGVIGPTLIQISYWIVDQLSNFMLNAFKFSTLEEVVVNLPGLEGADNALLYMAFGLAIILFAFGIYQYFLSPKGSREGAMAQVLRFSAVCFFIGNSTLVIEKVLSITYRIYSLALNSNTGETALKGENFDKLINSLQNPENSKLTEGMEGAVNAVISWNIFGMVIGGIFFLILICYVVKLWLKMFERYVNFIVELYLFPVTVSFMANASMQDVFFTYLRALISQYMIMLLNIFFVKVAIYNIVNGFFLVLLNESNIFESFFFSVAFVKIALKIEELIQTWGLFGMSAGTVLDDARNVLQVMRDGALFMGGTLGGKGVTGGIGGSAKAMASSLANSKVAKAMLPGTLIGGAVKNAAKGGVMGAINGFQNGEGVSGKLKGALAGGGKGMFMKPNGRAQMAKGWANQKKVGAAVQNMALRKGASLEEAKKLSNQAMNAMRNGKNVSTAADIRKPMTKNAPLTAKAKSLCSNTNGFVSRNEIKTAAGMQKKKMSRKMDMVQAQSLIGSNIISDSPDKGLGTCIGGTYNKANGTASLNFMKTKENGEKEYTKATAIPLNDTAESKGYAAEILKAADSSGIKYMESVSDDGQKWAVLEDNKLPKNISQEMEHRESFANTVINTDLQSANSTIREHNAAAVETILNTSPEKFIQCSEDGADIKYRGESDVAAEAFRDWIAANNFANSSNDKPYDLDSAAKDVYQAKLNKDQQEKLKSYWKRDESSDEETKWW